MRHSWSEGGDLPSCSEGCHPFVSGRRPAGAWQGHLRSSESEALTMPLSRPMPSLSPGAAELRIRDRTGIYRAFYLQPFAAGHFGVSRIREEGPGDTGTRAGFGKKAVKGVAP